MIFRRLIAALALLFALVAPAHAQKTKATLNTEISVNFPDNTAGFITPLELRNTTLDIVNSIMPTAPVVSGNLACYSGTTGLLQDCGTVPVPSITCAASTWVNSLLAGVLSCTQPNFTDLAGSIAAGQIPAGTITNAMVSASAGIALSKLASQVADTYVGNASGTGAPTAQPRSSCSGATSALKYTAGTGEGCQTFGTIVSQPYTAGTWTPTLIGASSGSATYTTQVGSYEQIGQHITARFTLVTASVSSIVGNALIGGLPVTIGNVANDTGSCVFSKMQGVTLDASYTFVGGVPIINTTTIALFENGSGQTSAQFGAGKLAAATTLVGFCEYHS